MTVLGWRLRRRGFATSIHRYFAARGWIEDHAERLERALERTTAGFTRPFHLVGHSMGGLVIRAALARRGGTMPGLGRVVFLGTPHRGALLAERHAPRWWYRWLFGKRAGMQLRPGDAFYARTPPPSVCFGTIAGGRGRVPGRNRSIPEDNDRIVEVSSTHLDGEADWRLLDADHHGMQYRRDVADAVARFLRTGRFGGEGAR